MHLISDTQNPEAVFAFCDVWLEHLARGDYGGAHSLLVQDGHSQWTPEMIERLISNYGHSEPLRAGRICHISPPSTASDQPCLNRLCVSEDDDVCTGMVHSRFPFAVYWFKDRPSRRGAVGWLHIDYPLDGTWSDLSSLFDIVPRSNQLAFDLERIEVL